MAWVNNGYNKIFSLIHWSQSVFRVKRLKFSSLSKMDKNFYFDIFTQLFETCVAILYVSEECGYNIKVIDLINNW